ncbi:MAG: A/G-specific adenine glycosylase [Puniceicoccales bacterium]|jgi:A/G-specific adenine glycosylase|nr:A/G-specific adenine glycosylase [Puniceicoccales bacterium]
MKFFPAADISFTLLSWGTRYLRFLPWRINRSLYGTIVSEFMLQQTQVQTVIPYFSRWTGRFPTVEHVARAGIDEILKHWEGLGYYNRARNLHRLCQLLCQMDALPQTPEEWLAMPGVGPYTAVAISAIGQNFDAIALDGNIIRTLARLIGHREVFKNKNAANICLRSYADSLVIPGRCALLNEALMDFGATVCTPRGAFCKNCPIKRFCQTYQQQLPAAVIPAFARPVHKNDVVYRLLAVRDGKILLQTSRLKRLRAIYEFPQLLLENMPNVPSGFVGRRNIGNHCYEEHFVTASGSPIYKSIDLSRGSVAWISPGNLDDIVLSGPHRRWLPRLLDLTANAEITTTNSITTPCYFPVFNGSKTGRVKSDSLPTA